jgi:hypothetical protein
MAGTGKSTIARTIARKYHKLKRLGASFFFSRGGGDLSQATKFFTAIAMQLADNIPALKDHICKVIDEKGHRQPSFLRSMEPASSPAVFNDYS